MSIKSKPMDRIDDALIVVIGATGTGKTSLISKAVGQDVGVSHELKAATITSIPHSFKGRLGNQIMLIDTPGFNGSTVTDVKVLRNIAFFLTQVYHEGLKLAGIIYLHRITDNKVSGSCKKMMEVVQNLVGVEAFPHVVLVSTMWQDLARNSAALEVARRHEAELKGTEGFWGAMCKGGSEVMRWDGSRNSALAMIDYLSLLQSKSGSVPLLIQQEMVDLGLQLSKTKAGKAMRQDSDSEDLISDYPRRKNMLETKFREEMAIRQKEYDLDLTTMKKESELAASEAEISQEQLQVDFKTLAKEKLQQCEYLLQVIRQQLEGGNDFHTARHTNSTPHQDSAGTDSLCDSELEYNKSRLEELDSKIDYLETLGKSGELVSVIQERERVRKVFQEFSAQSETRKLEKHLAQSELVLRGQTSSLPATDMALQGLGVLAGVGMTVAGAVTGVTPLLSGGISLTTSSFGSIRKSN